MTILVVDDEPGMSWAIRRLLGARGWRAITAASGAEALAAVRSAPIALALVDAKLPDVDGLELASRIRAANESLPLILMSAYFYPDDPLVQAALASGLIREFIAKPFRHKALLAALDRALGQAACPTSPIRPTSCGYPPG